MEPKIQKITHNESKSSTAAQTVVSVDDLLTEIFLWLPLKSLIRFKSVSKRWQSLICDPGFGIRRNPNPNPATALILQVPIIYQLCPDEMPDPYAHIVSLDGNTSPQIRTLKMLIDPWAKYVTNKIESCCNGLILMCRTYRIDDEHHPMRYDYYVCNPTTNKYSKLPQINDQPNWALSMCLAFDPSKSPHYKVVCALTLLQGSEGVRKQFLVYSSETGCWRKSCVESFQAASNVDFQRGVFWNGAMHWVNKTKNGKSIYFDPKEDRMSLEMMPTPPIVRNNNPKYYFGESCGHLHYIDDCVTRMETKLDVYELRSDYSEWFIKFRICDPSFSVYRQMPFLCAVVRGKSDDDDSFSVLLIEGKLERYDFLNKTRETICQVAGSVLEQCFKTVPLCSPLQHSESLCSV